MTYCWFLIVLIPAQSITSVIHLPESLLHSQTPLNATIFFQIPLDAIRMGLDLYGNAQPTSNATFTE